MLANFVTLSFVLRIFLTSNKIFLLYSQLQASSSAGEQDVDLGGLGAVDSHKGELPVRIGVSPPNQDLSGTLETPKKDHRARSRSVRSKKPDLSRGEPVEFVLFQDTTALRTRQGDTGEWVLIKDGKMLKAFAMPFFSVVIFFFDNVVPSYPRLSYRQCAVACKASAPT